MNNKKHKIHAAISLALLGGLLGSGTVQAGGFSTPTYGAPGWGRAFGGGSLFKNDPSAAFNNPAAMAFIDHNVAQLTVDYARIKMKYKGDAFDYQGNPATTIPVDANGEQGAPGWQWRPGWFYRLVAYRVHGDADQ